jgi:hypothetical protein
VDLELHLNVRSKERSDPPFHAWLALPHAEPAVSNRNVDHRRPLVATTMLDAVGVTRWVDIETRVKWIDSDDEVHRTQAVGDLAAQVDQPITGIARQDSSN